MLALMLLVVVFLLPDALSGQSTGTLRGIVRDAASGLPVTRAQVWAPGTFWGAVTDRGGRFTIPNVSRASFGLVVRRCLGAVSAIVPVAFEPSNPSPITLVADEALIPCAAMPRAPWIVDQRDSLVEGYYVSSWEGRPFFTCSGNFEIAEFPDSLYQRLNAFRLKERESLFVRGYARWNDDPNWPAGGPLRVGRLVESRRPGPHDCPAHPSR